MQRQDFLSSQQTFVVRHSRTNTTVLFKFPILDPTCERTRPGSGTITPLTQLNLQMKSLYIFFKRNEAHPIYTTLNFAAQRAPCDTRQQGRLLQAFLCTTTVNKSSGNMLDSSRYFCIQTFYFGKIIQFLHS